MTEKNEILKVAKTDKACSNCEAYVEQNRTKAVAVVSCEGACLRGEISRRAANVLCRDLAPAESVRICQGSALSKNGGQRQLVQQAPRVLFLEGCLVQCASRLFSGFVLEGEATVLYTDRLVEFDQGLFASHEVPEAEIAALAKTAAKEVFRRVFEG